MNKIKHYIKYSMNESINNLKKIVYQRYKNIIYEKKRPKRPKRSGRSGRLGRLGRYQRPRRLGRPERPKRFETVCQSC